MARLSLGWLKPPKVPADGVMSLGDHLREFRYRVVVAAIAIIIGMIGCTIFYERIFEFMMQPWLLAREIMKRASPDLTVQAVLSGVTSPLFLVLRVILQASLILTSPIWLYQVWAYIRPALLKHEKRYAVLFLLVGVPLFLVGCVMGYVVLPQAVAVMMAFTPSQVPIVNLIEVDTFLVLMMQLMLIFGIGFLLPLVVVALNLVGVVKATTLKKARGGVIFGCFVFAAAATPGGDPFSMVALATPMALLFMGAEAVCAVNDRRRAKRVADAEAQEAAERAARLAAIES